MRNEPARQNGISPFSIEISAKPAEISPYDTSSPEKRAEKVISMHARIENRMFKHLIDVNSLIIDFLFQELNIMQYKQNSYRCD